MLCRLCLKGISDEQTVVLFSEDSDLLQENHLVKMIENYLYIMLSKDDTISTSICIDCCDSLLNFHRFWQLIEEKQITLREALMQTSCDVLTLSDDEKVQQDGEQPQDLSYSRMQVQQFQSQLSNGWLSGTKQKPQSNDIAVAPKENCDLDDDDDDDGILNSSSNSIMQPCAVPIEFKRDDETSKPKRPSNQSIHKINEEIVAKFTKLRCAMCIAENIEYMTFSDLREHFTKVHKCAPYVKCCDVTYTRLARLVEHLRWHQDPNIYKCNICKKTLRSKISLKSHLKGAHSHEPYKKPATRTATTVLEDPHPPSEHVAIKNEVIDENDIALTTNPEIEKPTQLMCTICSLPFDCEDSLEVHAQQEHQMIYEATIGSTNFTKPEMQKDEQEPHEQLAQQDQRDQQSQQDQQEENETKPLQLAEDQQELLQQVNVYSNLFAIDDNLRCTICEKICTTRSALIGHLQHAHKRIKKFTCEYCEKAFKQKRYLDEHVATHTGIKLHACQYCQTQFRCKSNMYTHIKRKHNAEWQQAKNARSASGGLNVQHITIKEAAPLAGAN